tara:strand:- start:61 stop:564 length:504 start_codon:yes stop_codon:yes gene_type:complete
MALSKILSESLATGVGGKVLQVVSSFKSDTASTSSTTFTSLGLSVSITPSSASNKILILTDAKIGHSTGQIRYVALFKDGAIISTGDTAGTRIKTGITLTDGDGGQKIEPYVATFLDSPATTSSITYAVYGRVYTSGTVYINRSDSDGDGGNDARAGSSIIAMEISA